MGAKDLKQPFRGLSGLFELLRKVGLDPSPLAMLEKPVAVRQQS